MRMIRFRGTWSEARAGEARRAVRPPRAPEMGDRDTDSDWLASSSAAAAMPASRVSLHPSALL